MQAMLTNPILYVLLGVPNTHERIRHDQDRMALIAFADGMQQVTLPRYT